MYAARRGFGMMTTSLPTVSELGSRTRAYREGLADTEFRFRANPAIGRTGCVRWVYVAETDAKARAESCRSSDLVNCRVGTVFRAGPAILS
jgi:hypothetical protein